MSIQPKEISAYLSKDSYRNILCSFFTVAKTNQKTSNVYYQEKETAVLTTTKTNP